MPAIHNVLRVIDGVRRQYSIETATAGHINAIPAIEQAAAAVFPEADLPGELRFLVTDFADIAAAQQADRLWVALNLDRQPVGFAMADIVDGNAHLDELGVQPVHSRRGLGTRLLQTVIDWAREKKHARLSLITFRHLPWNGPFYASNGFSPLADDDVGPEMRMLIAEEKDTGLNMDDRVVMRIEL